jgi:hypothetical protein
MPKELKLAGIDEIEAASPELPLRASQKLACLHRRWERKELSARYVV